MADVARDISLLAREVLDACRDGGLTVATVESCTGGLVAAAADRRWRAPPPSSSAATSRIPTRPRRSGGRSAKPYP